MAEELWIDQEHAKIEHIKDLKKNNKNGLRLYCCNYPEEFNLQVRTFKGIGEFGGGVPRNMIATIRLTREQLHQICNFADGIEK